MSNLTSLSFQDIKTRIDKILSKKSLETECELLRSSVSNSPTTNSSERFLNSLYTIRPLSLRERKLLALIHWYLPKEVQVLINLMLIKDWRKDQLEVRNILLSGRNFATAYWLTVTDMSTCDFFGNFLTEKTVLSVLSLIRLSYKTRKEPKETQFVRGYRDKGTLRFSHDVPKFLGKIESFLDIQEREERLIEQTYSLSSEIYIVLKKNNILLTEDLIDFEIFSMFC